VRILSTHFDEDGNMRRLSTLDKRGVTLWDNAAILNRLDFGADVNFEKDAP
jgi:hypothetical protein